jgi:hypothetical protein
MSLAPKSTPTGISPADSTATDGARKDWCRLMQSAIPMRLERTDSAEVTGGRRRIVTLEGKATGLRWRHQAGEAIRHIEAGFFYYFFFVDSRAVMVEVAVDTDGTKYLKGSADAKEPDSLLNLENRNSQRG